MEPIKSRKELETIFKSLSEQGFGYFSDYEAHQNKINKIISESNTLRVDKEDYKFKEKMYSTDNYEEAKKEAINFFSKFKPNDKIFELLNTFYLSNDDSASIPSYNYPSQKEIIKWMTFKNKYKLNDKDFGGSDSGSDSVEYFNLDKSFLKIHYSNKDYNFKQLYELIFGEKCNDFSGSEYGDKKYGIWQNIGKIDIKIYQNGYSNIKGDLTKLKEYYYKTLIQKNKIYGHTLIKYNDKIEIIKQKEEY
jgi:hypothetical protein